MHAMLLSMEIGVFREIGEFVSNIGLPAAISFGFLYLVLKIGSILPGALKEWITNANKRQQAKNQYYDDRQRQYDEQMATIIAVAQQSVEAQRQGTSVIERNNTLLESTMRTFERVTEVLSDISKDTDNLATEVRSNSVTTQRTYTEAVRASAAMRQLETVIRSGMEIDLMTESKEE